MKTSITCVAWLLLAAIACSAEPRAPDSPYSAWKHSGSLWLLTTPDGANLPAAATIEDFPVLVRLHRDFFDFRQAQPRGGDLRFTTAAGERLAHQVEDWDADRGVANVWVRVPRIRGDARQELRLFWGAADAANESDGRAVFNRANGYLSVWHMNEPVRDEVGTLTSTDTGTAATAGMIGPARRLPGGKGVFCGEMIPDYPVGANPHSTEAWFRAEKPNGKVLVWGNEHGQGKVVMHYRSPPHVKIECYFSGADIAGDSTIPLGQWVHVVHTYEKGNSRVYVNGALDGVSRNEAAPLAIKSPARLFLGGWYHNYDFVGDLDEVRISQVARSADWIKLQYENQKPNQSLVGPLVQPGDKFAVSESRVALAEGRSATITAQAGGAQKIAWVLKRGAQESVVATDRFRFTFDAGRVVGDQSLTLLCKAIYPDSVQTKEIAIAIREDIPEPDFTLPVPLKWDGRTPLEITPRIANLPALKAKGVEKLNVAWTVDDVAVIKEATPEKLLLTRAQGSGTLRISAAIDNGGQRSVRQVSLTVQEPPPSEDAWVRRPASADEQPEDNQFYAREGSGRDGKREGTLVYAGTLAEPADSVFVRVFAGDESFATQSAKPNADRTYSLSVPLTARLVKYRTEFGVITGDRETVLHRASNIVCGDAYLINGQSNAVATDFGKDVSLAPDEWVRTFGATDGGAQGSRLKLWANAEARSPGGRSEIGYWGLELGRRLVEQHKIPICILNGAVGGTRIDQHQRNAVDPTDATTIYGRLLWRVRAAKLTHGIRAVIWHQGENDQGADGPTGGYGYETYRQFFVELAAAWKQDYPNIQHYYVFQIWPKSCAMGVRGSDNRLREVQRTLPRLFSNLSVMSTLGVKPPGGCHFPAAGYAEFARLLQPVIDQQLYFRAVDGPVLPADLRRAYYSTDACDELVLEFDQPITWSDSLASQFHLEGEPRQVVAGRAQDNRLTLQLKGPSQAAKITYLDSAAWSPDNLLYGRNGIAALTFCDVPIEVAKRRE